MSSALATIDISEKLWLAAERLSKASGMMPKHVKNASQAFAIVQAGAELGMGPMESLRTIVLVQGKVTIAADQQLALAIRAGVRHKWVTSTDAEATIELTRPGHATHTQTYTMDDAKRANLANKDVWRAYPDAMLRARALTAGIRAFCPDVLSSCYSPEELEDVKPAGRGGHAGSGRGQVVDAEAEVVWTEEQEAAFDAGVLDAIGDVEGTLEQVCEWCEALKRPHPRVMPEDQRTGVLTYLHTDKGRDDFLNWRGL